MEKQKRRRSDRAGRAKLYSPGRPNEARREHRQKFWEGIAQGLTSEEASLAAGISPPVRARWFRHNGGMLPQFEATLSGRFLSFNEREEIAILQAQGRRIPRACPGDSTIAKFFYYGIFSYIGKHEVPGTLYMLSTERPKALDAGQFDRVAFDTLEREKGLYSPLEIRSVQRNETSKSRLDGTIRIAWQGREVEFQIEIKSRTAPKIIQEVFWNLRSLPIAERKNFLLVVPFITPRIREMAEQEGVSCLDLNGNYFIQNSEFLAVRLDRKNRFPESAPIKKIFSGNSSQVGRLFLTEKRVYKSVNEIAEAVNRLGGGLSLSAISKVLSGLADELVIEKTSIRIALLQPEKLLDRLRAEYVPPKSLATLKLKIPGGEDTLLKTLAGGLSGIVWTMSGESSAAKYTMTTAPSVIRAYAVQSGSLSKYENTRFYNVILEGTAEPFVYFDRRISPKDQICWASRLQTYLELSRMDKREREIAESIRNEILKEFK